MAAGTFTLFSKNKADININDLLGVTVKVALISSAWTPDASVTGNSVFADMSANEIAAANGYTAGGQALTSMAKTAIAGGFKFSSANPSWTAAGGSIAAFRYAVFYVSGTLWGLTNPVIGYFLGDTTPADIPATTVGNTLGLTCPAGGWFDET